jgi:hypothetical protein
LYRRKKRPEIGDAGLWLQSTCFPRSYEQQAQKVRADHAQRNNPARQASRGERPIEQHHSAYGHAITVTADDVFFNFSSPDPEFLKFYSSANNGTFLCYQAYAFCGGTGAGIDIEVAGASDPFQSMTGNQVIAFRCPGAFNLGNVAPRL